MVHQLAGCAVLLVVLSACSTPPPRPWLRYEPAGPHSWATGPDGRWVTRLHGVDITLDLLQVETRAQVTVQNRSNAAIEMRMGPEATSSYAAIGEVLLRQMEGPVGVGGPDTLPYTSMQPQVVDAGWRGTFHLDTPLGREPGVGQYFVLTVEGRDAKGQVERISMPLRATNAGTMPKSR